MEDISSMKPQLLDLIPKERAKIVKIEEEEEEERNHGVCEDKELELRLGPPGEEENDGKNNIIPTETVRVTDTNKSLLCLSYMPNTSTCGSKRGFIDTVDKQQAWILNNKLESSKPCSSKLVELQVAEKKKGLSPSAHNNNNNNNNTAVPNTPLQKRAAPAPVVGWPPIRSFRKNLASSSTTKPSPQQQLVIQNKGTAQKQSESCPKGLFVKINMDGVPIGRKVDLKAYDSYEKLSSAVDQLFRGLLAAQSDSFCVGGIKNKQEGEKEITGLLDGSGEYTLVYEDNEGDRMLVGDVPWHMFVTTVKRLRVLKSSEVSTLFCGIKQEKNSANVALR